MLVAMKSYFWDLVRHLVDLQIPDYPVDPLLRRLPDPTESLPTKTGPGFGARTVADTRCST